MGVFDLESKTTILLQWRHWKDGKPCLEKEQRGLVWLSREKLARYYPDSIEWVTGC